ncbi:MAG: putative lipid II flippase FtsW [Proteobacteria bacterium]|nr:putative lipid II flippase FtsW [Pseudomonadota bacterium]
MIRLDRTNTGFVGQWWWTVDRLMLAAVGILMALGAILILASSHAVAERIGVDPFYFANRQMAFLVLGASILTLVSMMNTTWVRRFSVIGLLVSFLLLVLVQLVGSEIKGSRQWISLLGFSLQPSEFAKPFFVVTTAWILSLKQVKEDFAGYSISIGVYLVFVLLLMLQPDVGMTLVVTVVWGAMLFLSGLPIMWFVLMGVGGILGITGAYFTLNHVKQRINTFINPTAGDNFQSAKSLQAFAHGGFLGQGPGEGEVKSVLPDSHTDFIFAVAGEELGIIASIIIVLIFAFVVVRGFARLLQETDLFTIYSASGLLILFGFQALVNMGVALNMLPNTGMTLPFISYGGSSMLAVSIAMGMVLALTRRRFGVMY